MIVKVLVENTEGEGLGAEHGLCLYVEYKGKHFLIDSGASGLFAENADKMGVDLNRVYMAFLSHAHYDHSGGYNEFFKRNKHAKVYLQKTAKNHFFFKIAGPIKKYIGIPEGLLDGYEGRFEYIDGAAQPDEGVFIVPHSSDGILERAKHTHMCVVKDNETCYDDFSHEQTVVFEEEDGLVCFNSCSHSGVDIVIEEVKRAFPGKKIKAYIGGFHMMGLSGASSCGYSKEEVQEVAGKLLKSSEAKFFSGHCTGTIAFSWLEEVLGERMVALQTGRVIEL